MNSLCAFHIKQYYFFLIYIFLMYIQNQQLYENDDYIDGDNFEISNFLNFLALFLLYHLSRYYIFLYVLLNQVVFCIFYYCNVNNDNISVGFFN